MLSAPPTTAVRSAPSASPSRRRRLLEYRPATAQVVMVVAGAAAFLLTVTALRGGSVTVDVAVAAADLVPGSSVAASDLALQPIEVASAEDLGRLLTMDQARRLVQTGARPTRPVPAGAFLGTGDLVVAPSRAGRAMSFPIDRAHAVGGDLVAGDVVDLVSVDGGVARFVLTSAPVLAVSEPASTGRSFWLTVEVDASGALELSRAVSGGALHVVRSTWAAPIEDPFIERPVVGGGPNG